MSEKDLGQVEYEKFREKEFHEGRLWNAWESAAPEIRTEWAQYAIRWGSREEGETDGT